MTPPPQLEEIFEENVIYLFCNLEKCYPLLLRVTVQPTPNTDRALCDAEEKLFELTKSKIDDGSLSENITNLTNVKMTVDEVTMSCVLLHVKLLDPSEIPYLKNLSDTGALTNVIEYALISDEFLTRCQAEQVSLEVKIDEHSFELLQRGITGEFTFQSNREGFWYEKVFRLELTEIY